MMQYSSMNLTSLWNTQFFSGSATILHFLTSMANAQNIKRKSAPSEAWRLFSWCNVKYFSGMIVEKTNLIWYLLNRLFATPNCIFHISKLNIHDSFKNNGRIDYIDGYKNVCGLLPIAQAIQRIIINPAETVILLV